MINTIIIDDEPKSCRVLYKILTEYCQDVQVKSIANNMKEGVDAIKFYKPDIVFLDIEMPLGSGFNLLEQFETKFFTTVMVTAYEHYAIKAIKASVFDYILKPVGIDAVKEVIERYRRKPETSEAVNDTFSIKDFPYLLPPTTNRLAIATQNGFELVDTDSIIWVQASNTYTVFHIEGGGSIVSSTHLKKYETHLESSTNFLRIHHSYIINLTHVKRVIKTKNTTVVMSSGKELEVSVRKKELLYKTIKSLEA